MTILGVSVLLTALSMLKGSYGWASTRHSAKGNGCSLEKYEGGDGTVNITVNISSQKRLSFLSF